MDGGKLYSVNAEFLCAKEHAFQSNGCVGCAGVCCP